MTEIMDTKLRVGRRHRSWPEALKREIVAASFVPGASVSMVARQYGVNTNLVFSWRRRYGEAGADIPQTPDQPIAAAPAPSIDMIEIELPRGYRVRIGGNVKAAALRIVLDASERR
jgi:transposase